MDWILLDVIFEKVVEILEDFLIKNEDLMYVVC